jgi:hypothetical protein
MAVAVPKLRSSGAAPAPSRTAPPEPKKRPRDRPAPGKPRKVDLNSPAPRKTKAAPKRKASPGVRAAATAAPARKPARRKVAPKRRPASVIPIAAGHVGRAAVGVTQLPESGLIHRLTRGRLWIGLLGLLLVGIVALNVVTLSFAASSGKIDATNTLLGKENSMLQSRVAQKYGQLRLRSEAAKLGLAASTEKVPQLIDAKGSDVAEAATRLAAAAPTAAGAATAEGEAAGEEGAAGEGSTAGEEGAAGGAAGTGEEASTGEGSSAAESEFTPEELEIYEREYAELLASEGVTEAPAG